MAAWLGAGAAVVAVGGCDADCGDEQGEVFHQDGAA
jgi:hypothetical protein